MLTLTPSKTEMWYELGEKAVKLGDWKNAEFAYRKFIQFKGDQTKGMQNIVLLHFVSGDFLSRCFRLQDLFKYLRNYFCTQRIAYSTTDQYCWTHHRK